MRKVYIFLAIVVGTYLLGFHYCAAPWPFIEQQRIASPDGQVEAVIATRDAFATDCAPTFVLLVPAGEQSLDDQDCILRSCHGEDLKVFWDSPRQLALEFDELKIYSFTNFWRSGGAFGKPLEIAVRLHELEPGRK